MTTYLALKYQMAIRCFDGSLSYKNILYDSCTYVFFLSKLLLFDVIIKLSALKMIL